ncbi:MAG: hypothetical protein U0228_27380 [Myxococcaceae bacterium]
MALYQLDSVGNRVGERKAPASAVSLLSAAAFLLVPSSALSSDVLASFNRLDELQSVSDSRNPSRTTTFTWDAAGNLSRQQSPSRDRRFDWDVKQTLTRLSDDGLEVGRYDYAASGLRTRRLTSLEAVEYVLDGDEVLLEADAASPSHPATRRFTFGAQALAVTDISASSRSTRALHLDALGSTGTESSPSGGVSLFRQHDAWGVYRNGAARRARSLTPARSEAQPIPSLRK